MIRIRRSRLPEPQATLEAAEKARRKVLAITEAFSEALVTSYEHLEANMTNSLKDRHVLAAAVKSQVNIIVTLNLRDFPQKLMSTYGIVAETPDVFLTTLLAKYPGAILSVIRVQAHSYRKPSMSEDELVTRLGFTASNFAAALVTLMNGPTADTLLK